MCKSIHETKRMLTSEEVYITSFSYEIRPFLIPWQLNSNQQHSDHLSPSHYQIYTQRHFILVHYKIHAFIRFMKVKHTSERMSQKYLHVIEYEGHLESNAHSSI